MRDSLERLRSLLEDSQLVSGIPGLKPESVILVWTFILMLFCVYEVLREN